MAGTMTKPCAPLPPPPPPADVDAAPGAAPLPPLPPGPTENIATIEAPRGFCHTLQPTPVAAELAEAIGNSKSAGNIFVDLAAASPPAMLYAVMPLCWTTREPDAALKLAAAQWLDNPGDVQGLLGASWLLFGSNSAKAKQRLTQLQTSETMPIARLASAQLWRLTPPPETKSSLKNWFEFRDSLLQPLRIGPTEFLADRLSRVSLTDLAVGEWTRIATEHGERYHRATQALEAAQQSLQREKRTEEAERLATWIEQLRQATPGQ